MYIAAVDNFDEHSNLEELLSAEDSTVLQKVKLGIQKKGLCVTEAIPEVPFDVEYIFSEFNRIKQNSSKVREHLNIKDLVTSAPYPFVELPFRYLFNEKIMRAYRDHLVNLPNGEIVARLKEDIFTLRCLESQSEFFLSPSSIFSALTDGIREGAEAVKKVDSNLPMALLSGIQACLRKENPNELELGWRQNVFTQLNVEFCALASSFDEKKIVLSELMKITKFILNKFGITDSEIQFRFNNPHRFLFLPLSKALGYNTAYHFVYNMMNKLSKSLTLKDDEAIAISRKKLLQFLDCQTNKTTRLYFFVFKRSYFKRCSSI